MQGTIILTSFSSKQASEHISHATKQATQVGVSTPVDGGSRFTVTVADTTNKALLAQVRGLSLAGLMTLGNHHSAHHLAITRGQVIPGHSMD